jgi:hypothetical protein|tara:strand:+ start:845 stop:1102 length:258 start_codon:yes stop_codon:yes gene_type:complete
MSRKNSYWISNGQPVPIPDNASNDQMSIVREKARRNFKISECDWTQMADNGMSDSNRNQWKTYRQSLRDLDTSDPDNITWPTEPS